jgi:hypothetical protein
MEISHIITAILVEASGSAVGREGLWTVWEERWYRLTLFSVSLSTVNWKCVTQGYRDLPKIYNSFQNSRHLRGDMEQLQYWEPTNIRHHCRKCSHWSNLAPGIFARLSPVLITVSQCEQGDICQVVLQTSEVSSGNFPECNSWRWISLKICSVWLV